MRSDTQSGCAAPARSASTHYATITSAAKRLDPIEFAWTYVDVGEHCRPGFAEDPRSARSPVLRDIPQLILQDFLMRRVTVMAPFFKILVTHDCPGGKRGHCDAYNDGIHGHIPLGHKP
jgi:hypothetical protein